MVALKMLEVSIGSSDRISPAIARLAVPPLAGAARAEIGMNRGPAAAHKATDAHALRSKERRKQFGLTGAPDVDVTTITTEFGHGEQHTFNGGYCSRQ